MPADFQVVDDAVLASAVEALSMGLATIAASTRQMEEICDSFQDRLGQLEEEMRPMKNISEKYSIARRNVSETVEEMEKVNEYFSLESEKRAVIAKGLRGSTPARVQEYREEVLRVKEAIVFFQGYPSLQSQEKALKGLRDLSKIAAEECLEEYLRQLRTVGNSVIYNATADRYEPVSPLKDETQVALTSLGECLEVIGMHPILMQGYAQVRQSVITSQIKQWSGKYETPPQDQEIRGAGVWIGKFIDFAVKLVGSEQQVWREVLAVSKMDSAADEAFLVVITPVVKKLAQGTDSKVQAILTESKLLQGEQGAGTNISHLLNRGGGNNADRKGGAAAGDSDRRADCMVALLEMSDALSKRSGVLQQQLRMEKDIDNSVAADLRAVHTRLYQTTIQICMEYAEAVRSDNTTKKNLPENADVHIVSSNLIRTVKRLIPYREGYETVTGGQKMPWDVMHESLSASSHSSLKTDGHIAVDSEHSQYAAQCHRFCHFINHIVRQLIDNLVDKSKVYGGTKGSESHRHVFLLNNSNYLVGAVAAGGGVVSSPTHRATGTISGGMNALVRRFSGGKLDEGVPGDRNSSGIYKKGPSVLQDGDSPSIAHFLPSQTQWLLRRMVTEKVAAVIECLFDPLSAAVTDDVDSMMSISRKEYALSGKLLSLEDGRLIKAKFSAFNEAWEEMYSSQRTVVVRDPSIRSELLQEARARVVAPFRNLFNKYKDVQFSKKHQSEYLRYPPEVVDARVDDLFQG